MKVIFYDVEHGSCTHIITPNGKHFLVDVGSKTNHSVCDFIKRMNKLDGGRLDYFILTHPHDDHLTDIANLVNKLHPRVLCRHNGAFPLAVKGTESAKAIIRIANDMSRDYCHEVSWAESPANPMVNGGVEVQIFKPNVSNEEKDNPNYFSLVVVLSYGNFKVVLTGDNPCDKLSEMLKKTEGFKDAVKNATVLLAPHHGRDSDFCQEFVEAVNPQVTVISDKPIEHETQRHIKETYFNATRGVKWNGESRRVFTTRSDNTIEFSFRDSGNWSINTDSSTYGKGL